MALSLSGPRNTVQYSPLVVQCLPLVWAIRLSVEKRLLVWRRVQYIRATRDKPVPDIGPANLFSI